LENLLNLKELVNMNKRQFTRFVATAAALGVASLSNISTVSAQQHGTGLYDPEPPADAAYVRLIVVAAEGPMDVLVDGKVRSMKLPSGEVSDYMVIPSGKHQIAIHAAGKPTALLTYTLETPKAKSLTLAFSSTKAGQSPTIFEDKGNTNKLKAVLAAYHLDQKAGNLDILTADGSTKVFSGLVFGASNALQVNPINVELIAAKAGESSPALSSKTPLSLTQGATYSMFLLPDSQGKLQVRTVQNKTERYTGK
jgi:alginate O-acetyltransferase complex protein AlgF